MGLKTYNVTAKTGLLVGAIRTTGDEDVILVSNDGTTIRMAADGISRFGRATQGVILTRPGESAAVVAVAHAQREEEDETEE